MVSDTSHAPPSSNSAPAAPVAPPVPAPSGRLPRLVRWAVWCAAAGSAIVAAYFGILWWCYRSSHSITDDAFVEAHIVNIAPEMVSGRIVRFVVDEYDQEETRAHDAARAELRLADARLAKSEAARTKIEVAKRDLEVAQTLVAKAGKALDLVETGYDQIREVELMVGVKKEMVKDAQIALTSAQHQYQFTQIRAPFPGVVVKRYRNLGDFASPGVAVLSMYNAD